MCKSTTLYVNYCKYDAKRPGPALRVYLPKFRLNYLLFGPGPLVFSRPFFNHLVPETAVSQENRLVFTRKPYNIGEVKGNGMEIAGGGEGAEENRDNRGPVVPILGIF